VEDFVEELVEDVMEEIVEEFVEDFRPKIYGERFSNPRVLIHRCRLELMVIMGILLIVRNL